MNTQPSRRASASVRRLLAAIAVVFGGLAAVSGSPPHFEEAYAGRLDVAGLAHEIADEKDHVTALQLAQWIRDRKAGLRVVDVRPSDEREEGRIPTAEVVDLGTLVRTAFRPTETIVLYSTEGVHAGQAWVLLRARGHRAVFFLRGGWSAWFEEVMYPTLEENASAEARTAFAHAATLSRYFGGVPRTGAKQPSQTQPNEQKTGPRDRTPRQRRGC